MNAITLANQTLEVVTADGSLLAGTRAPATIYAYQHTFAQYIAFAGSLATALDPTTLARYRQALYRDEARFSVATINRALAAVRSIVKEAAIQGYVTHELAQQFKAVPGLTTMANKGRKKASSRTRITPDQMRALLAAPDTTTLVGLMHRALLYTLAYTGLRAHEIGLIEQKSIEWVEDAQGAEWFVWMAGKNQTEPTPVVLGKTAKAMIDAWLSARAREGVNVPPVFTGVAGKRGGGVRSLRSTALTRRAIWLIVQRYADLVGLANIKPHDFRRFVGTQLAQGDLRRAQKQLRHKQLSTTADNYVLDSLRTDTLQGFVLDTTTIKNSPVEP